MGADAGSSRRRRRPRRAGARVTRPTRPERCSAPRRSPTITAACRARRIAVIADEIYHGIVDGPPAAKVLDHHPEAFVVNSFSKYWSMTGWRVGWVVVPDSLVDTVERLQQNLYICAPHVSQVAALAALDATDELDGHVARYREQRHDRRRRTRGSGDHRHRPGRRCVLRVRTRTAPHDRGRPRLVAARRPAGCTRSASPPPPASTSTSHAATSTSASPTPGTGADMAEACELLAGWTP